MAAPLPFTVEPRTLRTRDGVRIDAVLLSANPSDRNPGARSYDDRDAGGLRTGPRGDDLGTVRLAGGAHDGDLGIVVAHGFTGGWREPPLRRAAALFSSYGRVLAFDFRGHGRSGGRSTVGDAEIHDVEAAAEELRRRGCARIATVGFSMGGSVVVRHAGLVGGVAAAVSVSGPSRWYYRGTKPMRRVHWVIESPIGRLVARRALGTRIARGRWDPVPMPPDEAAALISPAPLLIVQGDADPYFPVEHGEALYAAARAPRELWIEPGYAHAEAAATPELLHRIARWVAANATSTVVPRVPEPREGGR